MEWKKFQNSKDFPINLPKSPDNVYKDKGWTSWPDFLGYDKQEFYTYEEARKLVHSFNLKSQNEWNLFCKSSEFDAKIPKSPKTVYKKYWKNMGDWLGTNTIAPQNKVFLDYKAAKELVKQLKIKNTDEWKKFRKLNLIPNSIPSNPDKKYKEFGWKGWADFLGKEK
jgi:hypothetical protein